MKPDIYFSTLNCSRTLAFKKPIVEVFDYFYKRNINKIEISSGHKYEPGFARELFKRNKKGVDILLHNYAPPEPSNLLINLSEPDLKKRSKIISFIKESIDITKKLGKNYFSFHCGFCSPNFEVGNQSWKKHLISRQSARKNFMDSLKIIVRYAEYKRVKIGIENHPVEQGNEQLLIMTSANELAAVFATLKSSFLHLHLDAGHLNVTAKTYGFDKVKFIKRFQDKVYAIHIHQNAGRKDEHLPFDETLWILPYLHIFKNLRYIIFETKGPLSARNMKLYTECVGSSLN